ncbi:hypothetical protein ES703_23384 [subsurface metagenome]
MPEEKISPAIVIVPIGLGLGLVAAMAVYAAARAAPPALYKLAQTCIEDETGFPVTIDPSVDPRSDKITALVPVNLWQYWHNTSGEPMPPWSITLSVTYPDGATYTLFEEERDVSAGEEWAYVRFSPFVPTMEGVYETRPHRTYIIEVKLLVEGQVVDELSLELIAQVP